MEKEQTVQEKIEEKGNAAIGVKGSFPEKENLLKNAAPEKEVSALSKEEAEKKKKEEAEKKKKRAAAKAYRDKYFAYYDDVKTKVSEDW